jgi:hypothetical protein
MHIHEQVVLRMARDRMEDAVRAAEQVRAIRSAFAPRSARVRLGSALVRLGRWIIGHPSAAPS